MAIFTVVLILVLGVYLILKWKHSYWTRRGVAQIEPKFLFGNLTDAALGRTVPSQIIVDAYNEFKSAGNKHGGIYYMYTPIWIPVDRDLIKQIFYKNFWNFANHGCYFKHKDDVLTNHLFNADGEDWKRLRTKLTPTFSTGKLKMMFEILDVVGDRLTNKVNNLYHQRQPLDIKEIAACYATDVIANCAFGIECNTVEDPNNDFRKYGRMVFDPRYFWELVESLLNWDFLNMFGYTWMKKDVNDFFLNIVKEMIEYRENNNITRNDFLHLLLELKNKGNNTDRKDFNQSSEMDDYLTFEDVAANVFVMYAAGFETTSTTISFLMYELARHPHIQEKMREELLGISKGVPNYKFTYEDFHEMKYCDKVICETLRMHTSATEVPRQCSADFIIPGTDILLEKGTIVLIPGWAIHNDSDYYANPRTFDPEHFSEENKSTRPDCTFLPFGEGPRFCIGYRFAMMEIKISIIKYLRWFRYTLNPKTPPNVEYDSNAVTMFPKGNILLDITPIE